MKYQPITEEQILSIDFDKELNTRAWNKATALVASGAETAPLTYTEYEAGAPLELSEGAPFIIPVLLPEELESGDNRTFAGNSVTILDDLPIPLLWQQFTSKGHDGSVVIGRIDSIERIEGPIKGWGNARGVLDTGVYAREAERLIRGKFVRGVSADLDKFAARMESASESALDDSVIENDKVTIGKSRLVAATVVAKPAFQEARIEILDPVVDYIEIPITDGIYEEEIEDEFAMESALIASAIPLARPVIGSITPDSTSQPRLQSRTMVECSATLLRGGQTTLDCVRTLSHHAQRPTTHISVPERFALTMVLTFPWGSLPSPADTQTHTPTFPPPCATMTTLVPPLLM